MGISKSPSLPRLGSPPTPEEQGIYKEKIASSLSAVFNNKGLNRVEKLRAHGKEAFFRGKYKEALADFNEAIKLKSDDPGLYGLRSNVYSKLQDFDKAVQDCNKMIELRPQDYKGHFLKANVLFHSQLMGKALIAYKDAFELSTDENIKSQIKTTMKKIEESKRIKDIRSASQKHEQSEVSVIVRDSDGNLLHKTIVYKRQQSPSHLYKEWLAATKIQSNWRGYMTRKWIESTLADARTLIREKAEHQKRWKAAIKIQALFRGASTRQQMKPQLAFWKQEKLLKLERERAFVNLLQTGIIPEIKQIRQESENVDNAIFEEHKSIAKKIVDIDEKINSKTSARIDDIEKKIGGIKEREEQKVEELRRILEDEVEKRMARENRNYIKEKEVLASRITIRNPKKDTLTKVSTLARAYRASVSQEGRKRNNLTPLVSSSNSI